MRTVILTPVEVELESFAFSQISEYLVVGLGLVR